VIPILTASAWREFRGLPPKRGLNQTTHMATVVDASGAPHKCYVKLTARGWPTPLTEAIAWMLSEALDLPRPRFAALIFVPIPQLSRAMPLDQHWFAQREALGFCSEAIEGKGLTHRWKWLAHHRTAKLYKSPEVKRIVAFDEWVENQDRHEGNVIRGDGGDYVPIDNEFILHSLLWMHVFPVKRNSLLRSARSHLTIDEWKRLQVDVATAARQHDSALQRAVSDIEHLINVFQPNPAVQAAIRTAIVNFLVGRSHSDWMAGHLGVIA
jgi:hypothetical protein